MKPAFGKFSTFVTACIASAILSACSSSSKHAPIIERLPSTVLEESPRALPASSAKTEIAVVAMPGHYIVKKGDTLIGIALDTGNDWKDLATWNRLEDPNRIFVGQQLRVVSHSVDPMTGVEIRPLGTATTVLKPLDIGNPKQVDTINKPNIKVEDKKEIKSETSGFSGAWLWPASGPVIENFSEAKNKGIDIALKAGDSVAAAMDGHVVYSGNALRGYGNLVIIKHPPAFLTAYAHNRKLLVKEGDLVKRGQQIAEAGSTDAERVKLHFEIRKSGKPVDPLKYLPAK